jgi:hypothetical protein
MKYTRAEALDRIREFLRTQQQSDETTCQTAARLGIYCRGYDKWSDDQLREVYPWLAKKLPAEAPRQALLNLIVAWDGARMLVHKTDVTCDAHAIDQDACLGFDRFSNQALKRMFPQLFQSDDEVTPW